VEHLSVDAARRIALAAQGFADPRPSGRVNAQQIGRVIDRIGVLQIDSVNVLCRSHYLAVFARIGPYPRASLDRMAWARGRKLFEYWAHNASLLPLSLYPLLRWRMQAAARWAWDGWSSTTQPPADWTTALDPALRLAPWAVIAGMTRLATERPSLVDNVLAVVSERGPTVAAEADPEGRRRGRADPDPDPTTGRMWNWQDAKIALEWLFYVGKVTTAARLNFERVYDLAERVIPARALAAPAPSVGDRLVARVDLKADREESTLRVQVANTEPGVRKPEVAVELADELRLMASWLELDRVVVCPRGDLAAALARAARA
jgi:uncharacterized protein YcaQ